MRNVTGIIIILSLLGCVGAAADYMIYGDEGATEVFIILPFCAG